MQENLHKNQNNNLSERAAKLMTPQVCFAVFGQAVQTSNTPKSASDHWISVDAVY